MDLLNTIIGGVIGGLVTVAGVYVAWILSSKHAMRTALMEKRFQAHQEGFMHLWSMMRLVITYKKALQDGSIELFRNTLAEAERTRDDGNAEAGAEGLTPQDWWAKNCLYLDPACEAAFRNGITESSKILTGDEIDGDTIEEVEGVLVNSINVFTASADLPPITDKRFVKVKLD